MHLSGNWFIDLFVAFGAGVLVSFTPCVYPIMPITASFIGGINTKGTRFMGFVISLIYVLGLAITYCLLGIMAAVSGKIFGQTQNNPYIFIFSANVLFFFALVMFDVIPLPALGINWQHKMKLRNLWSVLLFGMASGLIVGPCTAPVFGTLLGVIAAKQKIIYGVVLTFVFSYGVGASLILVGTFSGILTNLPKSGPWLVRVKQLCGLVLFIYAEYLLWKAGNL